MILTRLRVSLCPHGTFVLWNNAIGVGAEHAIIARLAQKDTLGEHGSPFIQSRIQHRSIGDIDQIMNDPLQDPLRSPQDGTVTKPDGTVASTEEEPGTNQILLSLLRPIMVSTIEFNNEPSWQADAVHDIRWHRVLKQERPLANGVRELGLETVQDGLVQGRFRRRGASGQFKGSLTQPRFGRSRSRLHGVPSVRIRSLSGTNEMNRIEHSAEKLSSAKVRLTLCRHIGSRWNHGGF